MEVVGAEILEEDGKLAVDGLDARSHRLLLDARSHSDDLDQVQSSLDAAVSTTLGSGTAGRCRVVAFTVPRSMFELVFLSEFAQCRLRDTAPSDSFRSWEEIAAAQEERRQAQDQADDDDDDDITLDGPLAWILPSFYVPTHSKEPVAAGEGDAASSLTEPVDEVLAAAGRAFEAHPLCVDLRRRLNNVVVARWVSMGGAVDGGEEGRGLETAMSVAHHACDVLAACAERVAPWIEAGTLPLAQADAFLNLVVNRHFWHHGLVAQVLQREWSAEARDVLLFRACNVELDRVVALQGADAAPVLRSISLGASLFAGCLYDATASVWTMVEDGERTLAVFTI